jgi:hypothetical protein
MTKDTLIAVLGVIALIAFGWALKEQNEKKRLQQVYQKKNDNYLKLLSKYLADTKGQEDVILRIKSQLADLQREYESIDSAIANKLQVVMELIAENKQEIAIEKLTLIIENILKDKYIAEGKAKDKKSCPVLAKLLEYARDLKWITNHHFNFSLFLKEKRNQEAHELAPVINENERLIAFFSGIEIIYHLKGIKKAA